MDEATSDVNHVCQSIRKEFLPFHRPSLGIEEEKEIIDCLRSGWLTKGLRTKKFEKKFAEYCGVRHAISLNSCTAGLHLSLLVNGISSGDEVITSPITFAATANVIMHCGARPVFVDVDPETLNMDVSLIEDSITTRTKAIIAVHFLGQPCDMDRVYQLGKKYEIAVIEDAAHAIETIYRGRKIGSLPGLTAFSFYATKNLTTGEGGMITTQDDKLAERLRILSLHGISKDAWKRYYKSGYTHWEILAPGYKYNMSDMQASLGIHQLEKVEGFWKRRKEIVERYNNAFKNLSGVNPLLQKPNEGCRNAYHLYVIRLQKNRIKKSRDTLIKALGLLNIGIGVHFRAVHLHSFYQETFGFKRGMLPIAESASSSVLSLPLYPGLNEEQVDYIITSVKKVISENLR